MQLLFVNKLKTRPCAGSFFRDIISVPICVEVHKHQERNTMTDPILESICEDDTTMDACEAREMQEQADKARALVIARDLRKRAQKLLKHAQKLESIANNRTNGYLDDPRERLYELTRGPRTCEIPVVVDGKYHFLDPAYLEYFGVRDLKDENILRSYIGTCAEVTKEYLEDAKRFSEEVDTCMQAIHAL